MNLRQRRAIHETAQNALNRAEHPRRIILVYAGICCALSLLVTALLALISDRISGTGGLGNIGLRSVLSTGQSVLPMVNFIIIACLNLGYHTAILSITRGFEATPKTLASGFRHFGAILRTMLLQSLIYLGVGMAALYFSSFVFMATPFSEDFVVAVEPYLDALMVTDASAVLDEAGMATVMRTLVPMLWIMLAVCIFLMVPIYYRLRMTDFCLADDPRKGAIHAMNKSRRLMRRNCFALFRLDLSLWWFHLGLVLIQLVCYGDMLLPLLGVSFPWSDTVSYYLFYVISLALQMVLYYFGMNRVYAAYAVAYDVLQEDLPEPNFPVQM